ncbi:hypothetical protein [Cryptosporangium japonicum]|uniref:Uncharacterized protein n=1 Tax=Cryptosporangium japonicum TaxID=80872 RepID=A0ABN0UJ49_9ACTN
MRLPGRRLSTLYVAIGAALLLAGSAVLYPVRHVDGFATELRINLGSNLIDLVLAVLVLQPLVLTLNRNAVRWRNRLDYREVVRSVGRARDHVEIWKYWTGLLEPAHAASFADAVRVALDRGVRFRIMLTDPSCPDAARRANQVAPTDAVALMRENIERLDEIRRDLPPRHAALFEVRISSVGPAHAVYRVDDWLSYGLFRNRRVSENYQREVRVHGDLGALALEAFDNRWNGAGLRGIDEHYRLAVRTPGPTAPLELEYVVLDGETWVDAGALRIGHELSIVADGAVPYVLADAGPDTRDRAAALFADKYGPERSPALLRLVAP